VVLYPVSEDVFHLGSRVLIDGQRRKGWVARFHVLAPLPQPVLGGPGGPSSIPNVMSDESQDDDIAPSTDDE